MTYRKICYLSMALLTLGMLSGCGGGEDNSPSSSVDPSTTDIASYKVKTATIDVTSSRQYAFTFNTDNEVSSTGEWYISSNSRYDTKDELITMLGSGKSFNFTYSGDRFDFYLLFVGGTENDVYLKQNFILPTINMVIRETNEKDVITFEYLNTGYGSEMFFEDEGFTLYRSSSSTFDSNAIAIKENVSIADEFTYDSASGQDYFYFVASMNSSKVTYTSQAYKKGTEYGSDLVSLSSAAIESDGTSITLAVGGNLTGVTTAKLALYSAADINVTPVSLDTTSGAFTATIDLSVLAAPDTSYNAYILFGAGLFYAIPSSLNDIVLSTRTIVGSNIYFLASSGGDLVVSYTAKAMINVFEAQFVVGEDKRVYFETSGLYDDTLFPTDDSGNTIAISNPVLEIDNEQNNSTDVNDYNLTLDTINKAFSVKADLTEIDKMGPWYNIKLWFNTTTAVGESGESARVYSATYEYSSSVADLTLTATDEENLRQYSFQEYDGYLKIQVSDLSMSIASWNYVNIDGKVNLRLTGNYTKTGSYFTVYSGSNIDAHNADVTPNESTHSFTVDINVDNIAASTNYHVHWILPDGGNEEVTNKYMSKPNSVMSSTDGYIFCVKEESWSTNRYYKVYKDSDVAKANSLSFDLDSTTPTFTLKGAINSLHKDDDLYVRYAVAETQQDGTAGFNSDTAIYSKVVLTSDLSFTAVADLSSLVIGSNYEARLVIKSIDGSYSEIGSGSNDYCGFYNEYLPSDFANASLKTSNGTYHVATYAGENNLWTLYLYLLA